MPERPGDGGPDAAQRTSDDRRWAVLSHLLAPLSAWLLLGFVAPLAILKTKGRTSTLVATHAIDSLNFQLSTLMYAFAAIVLSLVTGGLAEAILGPIAAIYVAFYLVVILIASLNAAAGNRFDYPLTLSFVDADGEFQRPW